MTTPSLETPREMKTDTSTTKKPEEKNPWSDCPYPNAVFHIDVGLRNGSVVHYYILEHRKKVNDKADPYMYEIIRVHGDFGGTSIIAWCPSLSQAKDIVKVDMKKMRYRDITNTGPNRSGTVLFL